MPAQIHPPIVVSSERRPHPLGIGANHSGALGRVERPVVRRPGQTQHGVAELVGRERLPVERVDIRRLEPLVVERLLEVVQRFGQSSEAAKSRPVQSKEVADLGVEPVRACFGEGQRGLGSTLSGAVVLRVQQSELAAGDDARPGAIVAACEGDELGETRVSTSPSSERSMACACAASSVWASAKQWWSASGLASRYSNGRSHVACISSN